MHFLPLGRPEEIKIETDDMQSSGEQKSLALGEQIATLNGSASEFF